MITALIRIAARTAARAPKPDAFTRLAGRITAIQRLDDLRSGKEPSPEVDLGVRLTRVTLPVLTVQGADGIRPDCCFAVFPLPITTTLPTGLGISPNG